MDRTIKIQDFPDIDIFSEDNSFHTQLRLVSTEDGIFIYNLSVRAEAPKEPKPITLKWRFPSFNVQGVWKSGGIHDKRQQYDWELDHPTSRISVNAPVLSVFNHSDGNVHTIACSDAIDLVEMNVLLREEDNYEYCHITFFKERHPVITEYEALIRIDTRPISFARSLREVVLWWETIPELKPEPVPPVATTPIYSTWYQFHQTLEEDVLLSECKLAHELGYGLIILDDGWQTEDSNRGYDYTGDWQPIRFNNLPAFVGKVHDIGMKFGLWFSVPFCGMKSEAYQKFKGKFLTENHRWAPVFDPRYPEVRQYLINIYVSALEEYDLDVFKLDFIDDFKVYPETVLTKEDGRDYASVNAAVHRLLTDALTALRAINPDIGIEFRQQYIGPALRRFGNMFRAFDCPNDAVSNRIRISDVKMLCGDTAVHSDPLTWHPDEKVEIAALQFLNGLCGVPQVSMELHKLPEAHIKMIRFYTDYWKNNKETLMSTNFTPLRPLSNYPVQKCETANHTIVILHEQYILKVPTTKSIDIVNAKLDDAVILNCDFNSYCQFKIYDCMGQMIEEGSMTFDPGIIKMVVPHSGMITLILESN